MTDFLFWLHANYIKPQVDAALRGPYAYPMDALHNELCEAQRRDLDKALEFTAIQAFLLGLRTGEGLARHIPAGSPEARTSEPRVAATR